MADNLDPQWGFNFKPTDPTTWLPTFGKWCGPGWSAGIKTTTPQLTADQKAVLPTKISINGQERESPVDAACRKHDFAYSDAYGQPDAKLQILKADVQLEKDLAAMSWSSLTPAEKTYASLMAPAFLVKIQAADVVGAGIETLKTQASSAFDSIKSSGNDPSGKSFTDGEGSTFNCSADPMGNLTFNCSKTLETGAKVEGRFNGTTHATSINTLSADTVVATLAEDQNGDGVVDKTTTKLDADHNGVADSTVVAITGGDTTNSVDANQNGNYETVNTLHTNGQRDVYEKDEANLAWGNATTHYDALGKLDWQDVRNDDGTVVGRNWGQTVGDAMELTTTVFDAQGRLDWQDVRNDDGTVVARNWGQTPGDPMELTTTVFDAQGRFDWQDLRNDDGTVVARNWGQTPGDPMDLTTTVFDAQGRLDWQDLRNDDGTVVARNWGQTTGDPMDLTTTVFDAQGQRDWQDVRNDDGSLIARNWGQTAGDPIDVTSSFIDAQGRLDERVFTYDDKTRVVFDFDEKDEKAWSYTQLNFNAAGAKDYEWINNKNGSKVLTDWDAVGNQPYKFYTDYFDSAGRLDYEVASLKSGNRVVFDYDERDEHSGWSTVRYEYNSANQMVAETKLTDTGYWIHLNLNSNPDSGAGGYTPNLVNPDIPDPNPGWVEPYYPDYDWEGAYW